MKKDKTNIQRELEFTGSIIAKKPQQLKKLEEAVPGAKELEKGASDTVKEILQPECVDGETNQPTDPVANASKKEPDNPGQQSEIIGIRLGLFGLWVANPGKRAVQITLIGMGFILLFTTLVFLLRHYL